MTVPPAAEKPGRALHVDVVIPAYNAACYLDEALDSVLAQTRPPRRVIVVDDASTDTTAAVAAKRGAPVELIRLDVNAGAAHARNVGIAASDAALVAFLDADDRWKPGKLAMQCAALDDDAAAMFALCRIALFASDELPDAERRRLQDAHDPLQEGWTASALLVRRGLFDRIGTFDEALRIGEVVDWLARARDEPYVSLDGVLAERRLHRDNTTRRQQVSGADYIAAVRRQLARKRAAQSR